ncbi:MAG: acetyl-CoA carboxylase, carboxyltransferase subunit beta [Planctomycetota bacterium]
MGWKFRKKKKDIPGGVWLKCTGCEAMLLRKKVEEKLGTCPECGFHFRIDAQRRVEQLLDPGTFESFAEEVKAADHLEFVDKEPYTEKLKKTQGRTGRSEAALVGRGRLDGIDVVFGALDFGFLGGSMGVVVGERVTAAAEVAREERRPLVLVSSSGGARMHEGALSLMQMAKSSAALARMGEERVPFVSVLADPCTGGVIASFAALGDVILAEPGALIGFAGPRVIATTIRTKLPEGFQRAEFLLEHGFIDRIVPRPRLRGEVATCLRYCTPALRTAAPPQPAAAPPAESPN